MPARNRRRLPPAWEGRLLGELEDDEWFREQVAEEYGVSTDAPDPRKKMGASFLHRPHDHPGLTAAAFREKAGALFLYRPPGWEADLEEIARRAEESELSDLAKKAARRLEDLESDVKAKSNQAKQHRRRADQAAQKADRRVARARDEAAKKARQEYAAELDGLSRENRRMAQELAAAVEERKEAQEGWDRTRRELERERRIERPPPPEPGPNAWADLDALEAARLLDEVAEAFSPISTFNVTLPPMVEKPLVLPPGVAPDDRAAVEWLLGLERAYTLLVDGYNVAHHVAYHVGGHLQFHSPTMRARVEKDLERWRGLAKGRPRVTVVYDSKHTGGPTAAYLGGEIEVLFTSRGYSADDELIARSARLGRSAVVVSSDKEIQKKAARSGSLVLWSEALAGWILKS